MIHEPIDFTLEEERRLFELLDTFVTEVADSRGCDVRVVMAAMNPSLMSNIAAITSALIRNGSEEDADKLRKAMHDAYLKVITRWIEEDAKE